MIKLTVFSKTLMELLCFYREKAILNRVKELLLTSSRGTINDGSYTWPIRIVATLASLAHF
jgi:hypothetical protein